MFFHAFAGVLEKLSPSKSALFRKMQLSEPTGEFCIFLNGFSRFRGAKLFLGSETAWKNILAPERPFLFISGFSESGSLTFSGIQQSLTDTERLRCNLKEFILVDEIDGLFQAENSWWS